MRKRERKDVSRLQNKQQRGLELLEVLERRVGELEQEAITGLASASAEGAVNDTVEGC